jgi:3-hydroxyacyl-[acyl-carrier-protein] dehydratase
MNKTIEELIPHRVPFLFIDEIVFVSNEEIIGLQTFSDRDNAVLQGSFPSGVVPNMILIESMAQCGGAGVRMLGIAEGIFALVNIETAQFFHNVEYDMQIRYIIKNIRLGEKLIRQEGKAYIGNNIAFEASWMSIKIG